MFALACMCMRMCVRVRELVLFARQIKVPPCPKTVRFFCSVCSYSASFCPIGWLAPFKKKNAGASCFPSMPPSARVYATLCSNKPPRMTIQRKMGLVRGQGLEVLSKKPCHEEGGISLSERALPQAAPSFSSLIGNLVLLPPA